MKSDAAVLNSSLTMTLYKERVAGTGEIITENTVEITMDWDRHWSL